MTLGHIKADRGFTLIELLVVIAIIGILSSVVLASLNTARNRGADAAVKSNLANARAEAELFYDSNNSSYNGVCANTATANVIGDSVQAAITASGSGALATSCYTNGTAWAAQVPLKTAGSYCVDSTGTATTSASALVITDFNC
jgi:prepilin-type N-terminal cleavage/methylation domain-containing protein